MLRSVSNSLSGQIVMDEPKSFGEMLQGIRDGDEAAAQQLLEQYQSDIRRVIRVRLTDPRLKRQMDSIDICQSVMGDFFVRASLGQFELDTPQQLIKLLATMAQNKLLNHAEKQQAAKRDVRRMEALGIEDFPVTGTDSTPSQIVANRELLEKFRSGLTPEEFYLADQRGDGRSWQELADELGEHPDALRKRLQRAIDRRAAELGFEVSR